MRSLASVALLLALAGPASAAQVDDGMAHALVQPLQTIASPDLAPAQRDALTRAADAFYGFWTNGNAQRLNGALAPDFLDHSSGAGARGMREAARALQAAVPDLRITVLRRELRGAQVISELRFYGHFMGAFEGVRGQDQTVDFTATDTLRVERGRITDVWRGADAAAVRRALQPGSSD